MKRLIKYLIRIYDEARKDYYSICSSSQSISLNKKSKSIYFQVGLQINIVKADGGLILRSHIMQPNIDYDDVIKNEQLYVLSNKSKNQIKDLIDIITLEMMR